jgi:hypothetical protein
VSLFPVLQHTLSKDNPRRTEQRRDSNTPKSCDWESVLRKDVNVSTRNREKQTKNDDQDDANQLAV